MDSSRVSVSLKGESTAAFSTQNNDSLDVIPHYLRPSSGSCHDICKYGRRRGSEEEPTKPLHKRTPKISIIVPTQRKKENVNHETSPVKPSIDAKSFSPRANKIHSPRQNTLSNAPQVVKRGVAQAQLQLKDSCSVGSKTPTTWRRKCDHTMKLSASMTLKPVMVRQSLPSDNSDRKRTRNNDVQSGKKIWMPLGSPSSPNNRRKTEKTELLSPRNDHKRVKRVKTDSSIPKISNSSSFQQEEDQDIKNSGNKVDRIDIENVQSVEEDQTKIATAKTEKKEIEIEFECESITHAPSSSSSNGEADDQESDKPAVSQRKKNNNKRRRKNRSVTSEDKHCRPIKLKFRTGNSLRLHEENNVARRHQFKRIRAGIRAHDSISENKSLRVGSLKASSTKYKYTSSKNRRRRARYGKTRIIVLEDRKGDFKRKYEDNVDTVNADLLSRKKNLHHHRDHLQRKKDVQYLLSYVIEETASKLAERRKGMVKSLVGAFETLISLQTRNCFLHVAKMNA